MGTPSFVEGPPYSGKEAYLYFCAALYLLVEKLEKSSKQSSEEQTTLSDLLEASRMRVKKFQQMLECEEASIRKQSKHIKVMRKVLQELEEQEGVFDGTPTPVDSETFSCDGEVLPCVGDDMSPPATDVMTLEDLKQQVSVVQSLRNRLSELENALDTREDRVVSLTEELERLRASEEGN